MKKSIMIWRIAVSIALMFSCILPMFANSDNTVLVSAISADYPMQLINIAANDNSGVLTENGTTDNSSLSVKGIGNDLSPSWRFDYVGTDSKGAFFKIVNAQSGRILTPEGYGVRAGVNVVVFGSESDKTQHWYVVPVKNDRLGNGLYYKIVNYMDTSLAITRTSGGVSEIDAVLGSISFHGFPSESLELRLDFIQSSVARLDLRIQGIQFSLHIAIIFSVGCDYILQHEGK